MGTGKTCAYCMFPFYTISRGRCGRFLMWFPLFIRHLLDNIGADCGLRCHIGSRTIERATTTEVKRTERRSDTAQADSVCTVRHS